MRSVFARVTAFLLIATLTINLGDWPFIDELLQDLQEQGIFSVVDSGHAATLPGAERSTSHGDEDTAVTYEALSVFTNVSPPPANNLSVAASEGVGRLVGLDAVPVEYIVAAPFRPPAA